MREEREEEGREGEGEGEGLINIGLVNLKIGRCVWSLTCRMVGRSMLSHTSYRVMDGPTSLVRTWAVSRKLHGENNEQQGRDNPNL